MKTAPLKSFARWARRELIAQVSARLTAVLAPASPERVENQRAVAMLERDIAAVGDRPKGKEAVADKVAYTWFNRIIALRFMDANGYTGVGVVSPAHGQYTGQPEILADAKRGIVDPTVVGNQRTLDRITGLLDGIRPSTDAQGEAYTLLLAEYCRYWNRSMPFMFEREGDYTELLIPSNLLAADSILTRAATVLTEEVCRDVEVIGWLYQFYISERKDEVFAGFKKRKKAGAAEIPAATQLFTPHWIVRYLVENSVGRLWMLNHPESHLIDQMDYYIESVDEQTGFLRISSPEELTVMDPACGSGHMLTYAFDLLYAIYEEEGYAPSEIPELILTHNLHGTEIDARAGSLAAFALTMKARAKQRAFFSKRVKPNICVIEEIAFTPHELGFLATLGGGDLVETGFWNQFENAAMLGSLIQPNGRQTINAETALKELGTPSDLLSQATVEHAHKLVRQAQVLSGEYAAVIANPPYMGSKNLDAWLVSYAKRSFPNSKSDLFAMFIERCLGLTNANGTTAMVTMQSWMFISSYEKLREQIVWRSPVTSMIHLGEHAFDSIGGAVVSTTAFVLEPDGDPCRVGSFIRAVEGVNEAAKRSSVLEATKDLDCNWRFSAISQDFSKIPGSPIAYWVPEVLRSVFCAHPALSSLATTRLGMTTANNDLFTRAWWEISSKKFSSSSRSQIELDCTDRRWVPYNKGGGFRRWYGNMDTVVDWEHGGDAIRNYGATTGKVRSTVPNIDYYFRECATWSKVSSGPLAMRYRPEGSIFDVAGACAFSDSRSNLNRILAVANSEFAKHALEALSPTLNFEGGQINHLPIPTCLSVDELVEHLIVESKDDWDDFETSWGFTAPSWFRDSTAGASNCGANLRECVRSASEEWALVTRDQQAREIENNHQVAQAFGLSADLSPEIPLHRVSLNRNIEFRYGPGKTPAEYLALERGDVADELISYALGCIFGRYSLDEPGLILADQGSTTQDYFAKVPEPSFTPDTDNVIPFVDGDWFEDDVVAKLRHFLRVAFGDEHFEANLRFVEESLGVKTLREYFITRAGRSRFYDDHVKRYKKRPIYWLFSSPKGSFNALVYMHRYTPSTVSTVLNEYLREFESKLDANLQHQERVAAGDSTPRVKAAALKEAERLRKILLELSEYKHDVLYPLASQQIAINLDDGVLVNYLRFGKALAKIPEIEKKRAEVETWTWPTYPLTLQDGIR